MVFPRPIITPDAVKKRAGEKDKGGKGIDYLSTETGDEEIKGKNERYAFISGANKADVKDLIRCDRTFRIGLSYIRASLTSKLRLSLCFIVGRPQIYRHPTFKSARIFRCDSFEH